MQVICVSSVLLLTACSPKYDWREVRGAGAPFIVTLPAKPATHTRAIDLDGIPVKMSMSGAEVDDVTFAVGAATLADATQAPKALQAMKTALVRNIAGTIKHEKVSPPSAVPSTIDIEASGPPGGNTDGQPRLLLARFVARDQYIYQVIIVGKESAVSREAADTFFTSFKPY